MLLTISKVLITGGFTLLLLFMTISDILMCEFITLSEKLLVFTSKLWQ